MHNTSIRPRKNKSKSVYRNLFSMFVVGLFVYFWLFVRQDLNQGALEIIFCFLFLIGCSTILGWRMQKEQDFEPDSTKPDAAVDETEETTEKTE